NLPSASPPAAVAPSAAWSRAVRTTIEAVIACDYRPVRAGRHTVIVKYAGSEVPRSPFTVEVGPAAETRVRAFGPGLEAGWVDEPAIFSVETNGEGELGEPGIRVQFSSSVKIWLKQLKKTFSSKVHTGHGGEVHVEARDKGGGAMDVCLLSQQSGEHAVHIIGPGRRGHCRLALHDPTSASGGRSSGQSWCRLEVRASGCPDSQGLALHSVAAFAVDASASGGPPDLLRVTVHNCRGEPVQADCLPRDRGCSSAATCLRRQPAPIRPAGRYTTSISYSGVSIPGSPFRVQLAEPVRPDLVRVGGPGVKRAVRRKPTVFTVDSSRAGPGETPGLSPPGGTGVELPVKRVGTGTPGSTGRPRSRWRSHQPGQPAGGSPFRVPVEPDIDLDKVHVLGLESHVYRDSYPKFRVDASAVESTVNPAGESGGAAAALVSGRTGRPVAEVQVRSQGAGLYECAYRPARGRAAPDGSHVRRTSGAGSPFPGRSGLRLRPRPGPGSRARAAVGASGRAGRLHRGLRHRRPGRPDAGCAGPGQAPVKYRDNGDGTWAVQYTPSERGPHEVQWDYRLYHLKSTISQQVKFADCHVPGSPFPVPVESRPAPDRVTAYGPACRAAGCGPGSWLGSLWTPPRPVPDTVRPGRTGDGPSALLGRAGARQPAGLFSAAYEPLCEGPAEVAVTFAGQPIPGSPFRVAVRPRCEPGAVVATGPGVRPPGGPSGSLPASLPAAFKVDARDAGPGELRVAVADPDGRAVLPDNGGVAVEIPGGGGVTACCYTPHLTGVQPFAVRSEATGDADKVRLLVPPQATVVADTEASIMVDASGAGDGGITCRITTSNDSELDIDLEENADGTVSLYYTPRIPGMQAIEIRFGGQLIPDGRAAADEDEIVEKQEQKLTSSELPPAGPRYPEIDFGLTFDASTSARGGAIDALIRTPSGAVHQPEVTPPDADGRCSFVYRPSEVGQHELQVLMDGEPVAGSPFKFYVDCLGLGHVTAYGPGLCYGRSGEPANFTVVTKEGRTR
uniref:Ig-like domain-containing protein n=1 Tax=Macrostomum lignano TaxID=282301 RepID=A0A1I8F459_9PLAT